MSAGLTGAIFAAAVALAAASGLAAAQTSPEPEPPAAGPAPCPKGYESLCRALSEPARSRAGGLGSQAGTGGKSTVIVHPEALAKGKKPE